MRFSAFRIWGQASGVLFRHPELLLIAPLLCVPVYSDVLHSVLISDLNKGHSPRIGASLARALRLSPTLLRIKLHYFGRALLWSLIPLYGWVRDIDIRLAWGLASNVVVFEEITDSDRLRARCEGLAEAYREEAIRALVMTPLLIAVLWAVLLASASSPTVIWLVLLLWIWLLIPGPAAANTYMYLWMTTAEATSPRLPLASAPQVVTRRRWHYAVGVPLVLIVLAVAGLGVMVETGLLLPTGVIGGNRLRPRDVSFLIAEQIIAPDEHVRWFYSTGLISIEDDGNLLTDRRVVSYERINGSLSVYALGVEEVARLRIVQEGGFLGDTILEVLTVDEEGFLLYLATDDGGAARFINELQRRSGALAVP